ncbi:unnamed protein product [Closterium sp. Naga37s-1]|nr:unnamed protein product [Closterium sp. Naga37s-1]
MGECAGREKLSSERGSGKMGRRGDGEAWRWGGVAMGRRGDGLPCFITSTHPCHLMPMLLYPFPSHSTTPPSHHSSPLLTTLSHSHHSTPLVTPSLCDMPSASMHHPMASRLVASGDEQQQQLQQQQHEEGNATSSQAGPGIPIDPSRITRLSWQPRAFLYSGFLSHDECDHLITLARDKVTRSSVADNKSGKSVLSEIRTSSGTFLNKYQDDVVKRIEERIAAWTFLPKGTFLNKFIYLSLSSSLSLCTSEHGEAIQILKYEIGQKYDAHFDYFFDAVNTQMGGHRVATVLMYLTTVEEGGETVFPSSQVCCWKERGLGVSAHRWAGTGYHAAGAAKRGCRRVSAQMGEHRATVLMYLTTVEEGGETVLL